MIKLVTLLVMFMALLHTGANNRLTDDELQMTNDFIREDELTDVIISSSKHLHQIASYNYTDITDTVYMDQENMESHLDGVESIKSDDNKQLVYVLVDMMDKLTSLIKIIKAGDKNSRLVILPTDRVNPYEFYKQHGFYNIYIITTPDNCCCEGCHVSNYDLYEICQHCSSNGDDQVNRINKWVSGMGFIHPLKLPLSFKNNFNQATLQVGTVFWPPYIYVNGTDTNGNEVVTGEDIYNTLDMLSQMVNAKSRYIFANGFKELDAYFIDNVIQMYGWPEIAKQSYDKIDQMVIISAAPSRGMSWYGVVGVFDKATWSLILVFWLLGGAVLKVVRHLNTHGDAASYGDSYWTLTQVILWDSIQGKNHKFVECILLISFMLGFFVIITFYFEYMAASMIAQDYTHPPIDNLQQMWDSNKTVLTYWNWNEHYAKRFNKSLDRFETFALGDGNTWFVPALEKIRNQPGKYVSVQTRSDIEELIKQSMTDQHGNHKFYIGKEGFDFTCLNYPVKRDAYFVEALNRGMLNMQSTGIRQHITDKNYLKHFIKGMKAARSRPIISTDPQLVTLQHGFSGGLVLTLAGYTMAIFSLIFEIILKKNMDTIKSMITNLRAILGLLEEKPAKQ